ncbi:SDR family NAD(P)-dependent oxidoreductase [Pseudoteredinibacter isoporae]|nr:SDR family NAD(P)-dependent oxidoreductase [Pseudoteredinibacter isoporae]NIB25983.1 SDR family NAD(P)-dependent oxidoreductase [Pseudoteredinibacter isoporae]
MQHPALQAGNVAVITGAASGLGLAAAEKFLSLGIKVMLADIDEDALQNAYTQLSRHYSVEQLASQRVDVSQLSSLEALRDAAFEQFGQVNVLMNNAGIARRSSSLDNYDNWQAILDINLWGVIHGQQTFGQAMIDQSLPGMIINTGSKQGITCPPGSPAYNVSKAAVKALTESLQHELRNIDDGQLSAHLLVPGFVYTGMIQRFIPEKPEFAWTSEQTIEFMMQRLDAGDFYIICPDNETTREMDNKRVLWGATDISLNRPALSRWHPDYAEAFARYMEED